MPYADLHTHTKLCNHAEGEAPEYLARAKAAGLRCLGVSDHFPAPAGYDTEWRMMPLEYPLYRDLVRKLKTDSEQTGGPEVLYGCEFDYVPGRMTEVYAMLTEEEFDYTIGSIHYVGDFAFDNPDEIARWQKIGVNAVWDEYTELLCQFVNGFDFNILGHCDLPKKFGFRYTDSELLAVKMRSVFDLAAAKNICIELNTAGLRKPVRELYPALDLLKQAFEAGAKITLGSDAHAPAEVAAGFETAVSLAKAAGYRSAWFFRNGAQYELPFD